VIARHMALVNFSEIGYVGYGVFCCFKGEKKADALQYLKMHPRVYWMADFGGHFDLAFALMAKNDFEFYALFNGIKEKTGNALGGWEVSVRMQLQQMPRAYLISDERNVEKEVPYFGNKLGNEKLDDADFNILKAISQDARMETVAIAKKVKMPASTVAFRMKKLEERGIMQGISPQIACQKYGYQCYQLFINIDNLNEEKRRRFYRYAQGNPNAIFVIETLGKWNFEVIYEIKDQKELQMKINEIRKVFPEIGRIESGIIFDHNVKYDQIPLERNE